MCCATSLAMSAFSRRQLHQHAELRRQVGVGLVQVEADVGALERGHAADLDLLAEHRVRVGEDLAHRLAVDVDALQRGDVVAAGSRGDDGLGEGLELLALGDEVGLAVELEQRALGGAVHLGGDEAVAGRAALALGDALQALDAQLLDGLVVVAVGLDERVLAVGHARAGGLAELLDVGGADSHVCAFSSVGAGGGRERATAGPRGDGARRRVRTACGTTAGAWRRCRSRPRQAPGAPHRWAPCPRWRSHRRWRRGWSGPARRRRPRCP